MEYSVLCFVEKNGRSWRLSLQKNSTQAKLSLQKECKRT